MKKRFFQLLLPSLFLFQPFTNSFSQGSDCADMDPICTDSGVSFNAGTGTTAEAGNDYGCLLTQPNPSWYYFEIATNGNIDMQLSAGSDIDFIIWGPFSNLATAQANCGSLNSGQIVDCSYSTAATEYPVIPNAQVGEVYIMLITNYANVNQSVTLTQIGGTGSTDCSIVANPPCFMQYFSATIGTCDPATGTYQVTGQIDYDDPPSTGDLVVVDCNGNSTVVASAPFTQNTQGQGSYNYTLSGLNPDGNACFVQAYFTADPSCTQTINYTAPVCICSFTYISVNIGACNPSTNTFDITGTLEFINPPTTGTLTVSDCNGNSQTFNAPFSSPINYALTGITPGSTTGCTVTATFSADPSCTITSPPFSYPADCNCPVDAGTFTVTSQGQIQNPSNVLCYGQSITITPNGDFIPAQDIGNDPFVPVYYDPNLWLLIYTCPPTVVPPNDLLTDPCLLGVAEYSPTGTPASWTITNTFGDTNTYYYVPLTMYDQVNGIYSYTSTGVDCYDLGAPVPVTFLPPIITNITEDCFAGEATVTIGGGMPAFDGSNFTVVPGSLTPSNAFFVNTSCSDGGTITIGGLIDGDNYSFDIIDDNGCPVTVSGTFAGTEDASFSYPQNKYCQDEADPTPIITGVPGGTFSATPAGLSMNPTTGQIDLSASTVGTYTIQYQSPAANCWGTETYILTVNPVPNVVATSNSPICPGENLILNETAGDATVWAWETNGGATISDTTLQSPVATNVTNGEIFTVTFIHPITGCTNSDQVTAIVTPLDDPSFSTNDFCFGSPNAPTVTGLAGGTFSFDPIPTDGATINPSTGEISNETSGATYFIEYLTNGTCPDSLTLPVTVNPLPTVNSSDVSVCLGGSVNLTASGATNYSWSPGTFLNTTTGSTVTSTPTSDITYTITGTDANGCTNTTTATVTVMGSAPINAGPDVTICIGDNTTLTASGGISYTWDNGLGAGATHIVSPTATTTYTVTGTDANGCTGTDQVIVTVNPLPNLVITDPAAVCFPNTVDLTSSSVTAGSDAGTLTYWTDASATTPLSNPNSVSTSGTYYIQLQDANGCISIAPVNVTINSLPNLVITDPAPACSPNTVDLTAPSITAGSDAGTYGYWTNSTGTSALGSPNAVGISGTYYISLTNSNGCTSIAPVNVTINSLPVVDAGPDQTVCIGASVTLTGTAPVGATIGWNNGVTDGVPFTPASTTIYTFSATDINGCTNTDNVTITVTPLPTVNAGPDQTVCDGQQVTLTGSGTATSYIWDNGVSDGIPFTPAVGTVTYTVTGTDVNGCQNTDQVNVTVNPLPTVNAGPDQTVCDGTPVILTGSGTGTSYTWDNGVSDGVPFTPAVGIVTYTVTGTDANGCQNTDQVNVTVNPLPTVNAGPDQTVCDGTSVTLTGSGTATSYTWDNGVSDGVPFTPAIGTVTYTVTGTDANGCQNTDQVDITVNPNPSPVITGTLSYCTGTNATLSTSNSYTTYMWSTGATTATVNVTIADNPITVTVTDANGCSGTSPAVNVVENAVIDYYSTVTICQGETAIIFGNPETVAGTYSQTYTLPTGCDSVSHVTLVVNPLPTVNAGADQSVCDGTPVTLTATGTATSYTWDNGVTNGVPFTPAVGTVTYTVTGTDANGCQNTDQVNVTVNPLPNVTANATPNPICIGENVTLTGSGAVSYSWNNGVSDGVPFAPTSTNTYTVTGTDANGCQNTASVTVTVNPLPTVNAGADQSVCDGTPVTLTATGTATSYTWNNGVSNGVPFTPTSTNTYTVTGTDANGCQNTDQVVVTVNPLPTVDAGPDQTVCDGEQVTLTGTGTATTYSWDNGVTDGIPFTPAAGTVTYTVTGTDANGCQNTDQVVVTVNPLPTVNAGPDQAICDGEQVTLTGSGTATSYAWDNGVTNGVPFTPTVGTVTYTVTGTDANGCQNTDQVVVTVNPPPTVDAGPDQAVCDGEQVTLTGSGTATSYTWDNGVSDGVPFTPAVGTVTYTVTGTDASGCQNTDQVDVTVNPLPNVFAGNDFTACENSQIVLTGSGAVTYTWDNGVIDGQPFPVVAGTYTVTGTDANGCQNTDQVVVSVENIQVAFTVDVEPCEPYNAVFTNNSSTNSSFTSCLWQLNNGDSFYGCGTVPYTFDAAGDYDVTLTVTTANGCTASETYTDYVSLQPGPIASFEPTNLTVTTLDSEIQFNNTSINADSYWWDFGDGNTSTLVNPNHEFPNNEPGNYEVMLVAISALGCSDTTVSIVTVEEELIFYVPNSFTPDADEYNQIFKPVFTSGYDPYNYTLYIYNRWGELIFESHDPNIGWDGTYAGEYIVQDGTYVWKIEFKTTISDERKVVVGHVNVLK